MKSIGNIWDNITDIENIRIAHHQARKGKSSYQSVQTVNRSESKHIRHLQYLLKSGTYKTSEYDVEIRMCGSKERVLHKLPYYPDRVAHHAFLNQVASTWSKRFIRDTFQSIKGRGPSDCLQRVLIGVREYKPKYAIKLDIVKYYPSLTNEITANPDLYRIRDTRAQDFLFELIYSLPFLPLGNHPSQYIGNLVITVLDWLCKQKLKIKHYFRYCDDIVILGDSKFELDIQTTFIQDWLASIGLECRISDPIPLDTNYLDFVGFRVNHHKTLLRKGLADNFKSSVRARNLPSIPSYYGWCKEAGALNLFHKHVGAFP